jgi:AFG3 family protein
MWDRMLGSGKIVDVSEEQGMRFLLDPKNEITVIYVSTERREATVVSPNHPPNFRFHITDFNQFEIAMRHVESPRPIQYDYHVAFPWTPVLLLFFVPILGMVNARMKVSRMVANRQATAASTQEQGHFKLQKEKPSTGFKEIAGMTEPKHEVREVVDFLTGPEKFQRLGATVPKGILLSGVPGVGKTMLARAVAAEAKVNFIACAGSEFVEIYVGVGASRVRELFQTAKDAAPCVVFIDEIDAFAKSRKLGSRSSSEGDNTVNALLSEMDGFHGAQGVVVMAGTNRVDILDEALLRPGRFDRKIQIDAPPFKDRVEIFQLHLKPLLLTPSGPEALNNFANKLASLTPGNTGADIKNICNEAAIIAAREAKPGVDMDCFVRGIERVQIGLKRKSKVLTPTERERAACHEAGHAVVNWHLEHSDPICKVSIVQYGGNRMSVNQKVPTDKYIRLQSELDDRMCDLLGGLAAEDEFMSDVTSAAAEDLHAATQLAFQYISRYGMCPNEIGHFSFPDPGDQLTIQKPYGSKVEAELDRMVGALVSKARERARSIIKREEQSVRTVMGLLLKEESLTAKDLTLALGPRKSHPKELTDYLLS